MPCITCNKIKCCCNTRTVTKIGQGGRNGRNGRKGDTGSTGPGILPLANIAFVSKNGNDATGLVERLDKPFLTITAATLALDTAYPVGGRSNSNRKLVHVFDGIYQENIFFKKYIDYYLGNVTIIGIIGDNGVDLGASANGDWTNIISGNSNLNNSNSAPSCVVSVQKPNTKALITCNEIVASKFEGIGLNNGILKVICNKIMTLDTIDNATPAIEMVQGSDFVFSKLEVVGADITTTSGSSSSTIQFNEGGVSKNQVISLINCRVSNPNSGESVPDSGRSCIACGVVSNSNGKLLMYNTTLWSLNGKSVYVQSANTLVASYYHSNMANKTTGGSGTLTNLLTTVLTVNSAVEPGF